MTQPRKIAALAAVTVLGFGASFTLGRSGDDGHRASADAVERPVELSGSPTVAAGTLPAPGPVPDLIVPRSAPAPSAPAPSQPAPAPRPTTAASPREAPAPKPAAPAPQQPAKPPSKPAQPAPTVTIIGG